MTIRELPREGEVTLRAAVRSKNLGKTQKGRSYLTIILTDQSGEIAGKCWGGADEKNKLFATGDVIEVFGKMGEYNGKPEISIEEIRPVDSGQVVPGEFIEQSQIDLDGAWKRLCQFISTIVDDGLRTIVSKVALNDVASKLLQVGPGAMVVHHAYVGGLLEHIVSMCDAADRLCEHYKRLNRDLLIAGCILHDIGKLYEFEMGNAIGMSDTGKLLGHVAVGLCMVERACQGSAWKVPLLHLIVSHHGSVEHGALVVPKTPEALALHAIDQLDAGLWMAWRGIDQAPEGARWSEYNRHSGREYFKG